MENLHKYWVMHTRLITDMFVHEFFRHISNTSLKLQIRVMGLQFIISNQVLGNAQDLRIILNIADNGIEKTVQTSIQCNRKTKWTI